MLYNITNVRPLHDFVLVKRCEPIERTPGGVFVVTNEEQNHAVVVAVGPGRDGVAGTEPKVRPGDLVLLARFIGMKIQINGEEHTLVKWYDIQAVLERGD